MKSDHDTAAPGDAPKRTRLSDATVKALPPPAAGYRITYDTELPGFGMRVTAAGAKSFILNYRTRAGRERRLTIGSFPAWQTTAARKEATELKKQVDVGADPMAVVEYERQAPTVADLCARYEREHLPHKRAYSQECDRRHIKQYVLPALKHRKVADIKYADIASLHRKITDGGKPISANRVVALCSKMFALAIRWEMRTENPVAGVQRNQENRRTRYLSAEELGRLTAALAAHKDRQAADIILLLLLTGARKGEVLSMRWHDLDLSAGIWTKPPAATKQKLEHRVPLSAPAREMLLEIQKNADGEYVFPGRGVPHRTVIAKDWKALCAAAKLNGVRIHDCRHTYASLAVSGGESLPIVGALLGHSRPDTTQRYSHLADSPLRRATERVGAIIKGAKS